LDIVIEAVGGVPVLLQQAECVGVAEILKLIMMMIRKSDIKYESFNVGRYDLRCI
jgi:hypothetical protein